MMVRLNRLEENTILCALKVQLKRLQEDKKGYRDCTIRFLMKLNEEIDRIKVLINEFELICKKGE